MTSRRAAWISSFAAGTGKSAGPLTSNDGCGKPWVERNLSIFSVFVEIMETSSTSLLPEAMSWNSFCKQQESCDRLGYNLVCSGKRLLINASSTQVVAQPKVTAFP